MDFKSSPFAMNEPAPEVTLYTTEPEEKSFVYNTPSGLEDNAEILRAESLFFTTPISQAYSNAVYNHLLNIQDQCAADFSKFCDTDTDNVMMSFVDTRNVLSKMLFTPFMYRRRLLDEVAEQKMTGRQLLEYMRSFYVPHKRGGAAAAMTENSASHATASTEMVPLTKDNLQELQNSLKPIVRSHVMRSNKQVNMEDLPPKGKGPRAHRTLRMEPNHDMDKKKELDHKHHDGDHHGPPPPKDGPPAKDKPSDRDHGDHHDNNPPHGPPASKDESDSETDESEDGSEDSDSTGTWWSDEGDQMQDNYFPGALGFGAAGDLCMYKNVDMLSPPCVQAVGDLYAVREAYWESYNASQQHHHGGGFLFVLFFGVLLGMLLKKIMFWRRTKPFREFFHALNERPEIKADLEQKLGMEVPKMRCQGSLAKRSGNFCANLCFASLIIFGTLVVSLVISITSLEMTAAIVNKMEENSNEPVSPTAIILILLSLCIAQTALFVAGIKGVKYLYRRFVNPAAALATNAEPSAPPSDGGVSAAQNSFVVSPLTWYMTHISPRVNAVGQYFQRRSQPEGYVSLSPNGEDDREMIPVGSTHGRANGPSYAIFTGIPVNANNIGSTMVAVPVTARPVSMV